MINHVCIDVSIPFQNSYVHLIYIQICIYMCMYLICRYLCVYTFQCTYCLEYVQYSSDNYVVSQLLFLHFVLENGSSHAWLKRNILDIAFPGRHRIPQGPQWALMKWFPLWYFNIAIENGTAEMVSFPIKNIDFPWLCESLPEGTTSRNIISKQARELFSSMPSMQDVRSREWLQQLWGALGKMKKYSNHVILYESKGCLRRYLALQIIRHDTPVPHPFRRYLDPQGAWLPPENNVVYNKKIMSRDSCVDHPPQKNKRNQKPRMQIT